MSGDGEDRAQSTALVTRAASIPDAGDDVRLQQLWLALQQRKGWRSLALVPADKGMDTLPTADALAKIAWWYTGRPACVFDMRDLSLRLLEHQIRDMAAQLQGGERVFVALRAVDENPTAVPLAMAADAVVLCVELGSSQVKAAKKALAAVGKDRFIGSILVPPRAPPAPPGSIQPRSPPGDPE